MSRIKGCFGIFLLILGCAVISFLSVLFTLLIAINYSGT